MPYFNYHAKIKHLIKNNYCLSVAIVKEYNRIKPAMVFYFKNNIPMPVRNYMWEEYRCLIKQYNIKVDNLDNIDFKI